MKTLKIKIEDLGINYVERNNRYFIYFYYLFCGVISYSEVTKTFFINYTNVSLDVAEFNSMDDCKEDVNKTIIKFLNDMIVYQTKIINLKNNEQINLEIQ